MQSPGEARALHCLAAFHAWSFEGNDLWGASKKEIHMRVGLIFACLLAMILGVAPNAGGDPVRPPTDHETFDPGPGFEFAHSGYCKGTWRNTSKGSCTHVDHASSGELEVDDEADVYDPTYALELLAEGGPAYCDDAPDYKTRVLYIVTQSQVTLDQDRYEALRDVLRTKAERSTYWIWKSAKQTGGVRHVRYVCNERDDILIDRLILPNSADSSFSALSSAVAAAGYNNVNRKYLAFVEWRERNATTGMRSDTACGTGEIYDNDAAGQANPNNSGNMFGAVYLRAAYCQAWAKTAMHEFGHLLGGVQFSAPNNAAGHHVKDDWDRLGKGETTLVCPDATQDKRYDCNDDDYFNTSPPSGSYLDTKWNTARNRFLVGGG